jgi:FimV-like protein
MSIEEHTEIVDIPLAEEAESIHLINFDDDRSEMSELDEVDPDAFDLGVVDNEADEDAGEPLEFERIDTSSENEKSASQEVSDLEIDEDYDEARTQYELAKVFVDLGDDNGARKILDEIVADSGNEQTVIDDAVALLDSMSGESAKSS